MSQRGYLKSWQVDRQCFQRRPKSPERRHWKVEILRSLSTGQVLFQVLCRRESDYLELSLRFRISSKPDQNGFFPLFIGPKSNHSLALSGRFPLCVKDSFAYNLSQLWHGFVIKVICISRPSPNKTKLKFDLYSSIGLKNHTSYLSFFLHRQNFWIMKFTPKNANFSR